MSLHVCPQNVMVSILQFLDRLFLFITPTKYWPDYKYLRNVRNWKMYLYIVIQLSVLVFICIFKAVPDLNLLFPVVVRISM